MDVSVTTCVVSERTTACHHCPADNDSAQHTLAEWPAWEAEPLPIRWEGLLAAGLDHENGRQRRDLESSHLLLRVSHNAEEGGRESETGGGPPGDEEEKKTEEEEDAVSTPSFSPVLPFSPVRMKTRQQARVVPSSDQRR